MSSDQSVEQAKAWRDSILETAESILLEEGEVHRVSLMLMRRNPKTQERFAEATFVPILSSEYFDEHETQDRYVEELANIAVESHALAVAMVTEVWHVVANAKSDAEEVLAWRAAHGGTIKGHRLATEQVLVIVEHVSLGVEHWRYPIRREGGSPVKMAWCPMLDGAPGKVTISGRLSSLLPASAYEGVAEA